MSNNVKKKKKNLKDNKKQTEGAYVAFAPQEPKLTSIRLHCVYVIWKCAN